MIGWQYIRYNNYNMSKYKLTNGLYKIKLGNEDRFYGFDEQGYMVSGFNNFYGNTYYFEEDSRSIEYGAMKFSNVIFNGIEYAVHPIEGNVYAITHGVLVFNATKSDIYSDWYINPVTGDRSYVISDKAKMVAVAGKVFINGLGYIFDEYGFMKTGITKFRDDYYYLKIEDPGKGSISQAVIDIDGKTLTFGLNGVLENKDIVKTLDGVSINEVKGTVGIALADWIN